MSSVLGMFWSPPTTGELLSILGLLVWYSLPVTVPFVLIVAFVFYFARGSSDGPADGGPSREEVRDSSNGAA